MRRKTMLLTVTALTTLTYCSDNGPRYLGFYLADGSVEAGPDASRDAFLGFWAVDASPDAPGDAGDD